MTFFIHVSKYPLPQTINNFIFTFVFFLLFFPFSHSEIRSITLGQKHFLYLNKEIYLYFIPFSTNCIHCTFLAINGMFQLLYLKILTTYIRLSILWFGKCKYILYAPRHIFSHRMIFFSVAQNMLTNDLNYLFILC